jgi:glycogenin glucosyltransferase
MSSEAFVTLATNDGYALGALVLAQSIRKVGTKRRLVIMISNSLSDLIRRTLETSFDEVVVVSELNSNDDEHLRLLSRPELGVTFTKINCWLLEKYSKCVFLDADCVVLREIDDLFQREEFSAAPDAGWPDCFNSGVFVFVPSKETYRKLAQFASQQDASFDGGDQGLLNAFFSSWRSQDISRHLPFTYNVTSNTFYSYVPAITQFRNDIRVVHFAGALKPWQLTYNPQNQQLSGNLSSQHDIQREFLLSWWKIMYERVWPHLSKSNQLNDPSNPLGIGTEGQLGTQGGIAFAGSLLNYGSLTDDQGVRTGSAAHRRAWEAGHVDYHGRDSFTNIQEQLEKNIAQKQPQYHPSQQRETTPTNQSTSGSTRSANQQELTQTVSTESSSGQASAKQTEATTTKKDENESKK